MRKNTQIFFLWLWVVWLLALFAPPVFGADAASGTKKKQITAVYVSPAISFTFLWLADEAGLFAKYEITAKVQYLNPQAATQALLAGDVDIYVGGPELINARLRGAAVKYFGTTRDRLEFQIWGSKEITDIRQLSGKTLAVSAPRSASDIATRQALQKSGLTPDKDVKILYTQNVPASLSAVVSGKTAAGTLSIPTTISARKAGLNLLADSGKLGVLSPHSGFAATELFLKKNPNSVMAFLKATGEGLLLTRKEAERAKKMIAKYTKMDDADAVDEAYEDFHRFVKSDLTVGVMETRAYLSYLDEKEFPQVKDANPEEFIDNSFVRKVSESGFFRSIGLLQK